VAKKIMRRNTACMNTQPKNKSVYKKKKDLLWEKGRNPL
jgi:hypothetical protein